jgi:hypothetical protein
MSINFYVPAEAKKATKERAINVGKANILRVLFIPPL